MMFFPFSPWCYVSHLRSCYVVSLVFDVFYHIPWVLILLVVEIGILLWTTCNIFCMYIFVCHFWSNWSTSIYELIHFNLRHSKLCLSSEGNSAAFSLTLEDIHYCYIYIIQYPHFYRCVCGESWRNCRRDLNNIVT